MLDDLKMTDFNQSASSDDRWRSAYRRMALKGTLISEKGRKHAGELGLNLEALAEEHRLAVEASRIIATVLDLGEITLDDRGLPLRHYFSRWDNQRIEVAGKGVSLHIIGTGIPSYLEIANGETTVADILLAGVSRILQALAKDSAEYRHELPRGLQDIQFTCLHRALDIAQWSLMGKVKTNLCERKISVLFPGKSIDLIRGNTVTVPGVKVQPWPVLTHVFLKVSRWPGGKIDVSEVRETIDECRPEHPPSKEGQPETLNLRFPCEGEFRWGGVRQATSEIHFLKETALKQGGKLAAKLRPYQIPAVFSDFSKPLPATDYRASLKSGDHGPAPAPQGVLWPSCNQCGRPHAFTESIDFRGVPFAHLLPGSALSVFICAWCVGNGNWADCTALMWLPREGGINLITNGQETVLIEARQWPDFDYREIESEDIDEINGNWPANLPWFGEFFNWSSKAGGVPYYLQADNPTFDSEACLMEFIGQFSVPEHIRESTPGYLFHSTVTNETAAIFLTT